GRRAGPQAGAQRAGRVLGCRDRSSVLLGSRRRPPRRAAASSRSRPNGVVSWVPEVLRAAAGEDLWSVLCPAGLRQFQVGTASRCCRAEPVGATAVVTDELSHRSAAAWYRLPAAGVRRTHIALWSLTSRCSAR